MNLLIIPLAFLCEFVDSGLSMGYGTILSPILLLMDFEALDVVPSLLFSESVTRVTFALAHHRKQNVDFRSSSRDTWAAMVLACCAVAGTIAAVLLAVRLHRRVQQARIGTLVLFKGLLILEAFNRTFRFTWQRIVVLGTVASFNKGLSGGGYGPIVTGGQVLSGIGVRNAVGITCLVGFILYCLQNPIINWSLISCSTVGALLSIPLAGRLLSRIPEKLGRMS